MTKQFENDVRAWMSKLDSELTRLNINMENASKLAQPIIADELPSVVVLIDDSGSMIELHDLAGKFALEVINNITPRAWAFKYDYMLAPDPVTQSHDDKMQAEWVSHIIGGGTDTHLAVDTAITRLHPKLIIILTDDPMIELPPQRDLGDAHIMIFSLAVEWRLVNPVANVIVKIDPKLFEQHYQLYAEMAQSYVSILFPF